jgi:hypothetical protein
MVAESASPASRPLFRTAALAEAGYHGRETDKIGSADQAMMITARYARRGNSASEELLVRPTTKGTIENWKQFWL